MNQPTSDTDLMAALRREREQLVRIAKQVLGDESWKRWQPLKDAGLILFFVAVFTALFAPPNWQPIALPDPGAIAQSTVRAERDINVIDEAATSAQKQTARAATPDHFDYSPDLYFDLAERIATALQEMQTRRDSAIAAPDERRKAFAAALGAPINAGEFHLIEALSRPQDVAISINFFFNIALDQMIVADRVLLPATDTIMVRDMSRDTLYRPAYLSSVTDVRQLRRLMRARAPDAPYASARVLRSWILRTAMSLAKANLSKNNQATEQARTANADAVAPVRIQVQAGEVLVRRGDRVDAQSLHRMRLLNDATSARPAWRETIALAILLTGIAGLVTLYFRRPTRPSLPLARKMVYERLTVAIASAIIIVGSIYAALGLAEILQLERGVAVYLAPLALGALLGTLLIDSATGLLIGVGLALLVAFRFEGDFAVITYALAGVLTACAFAKRCRRRAEILRLGLIIAGVQIAVVPLLITLAGDTVSLQHWPYLLAAAISGLLSATMTLALLPLLELQFDEATDMRLLELASSDHPILRRLILHAPGTYYASVMVGTMSETAAEAIGANGLKCRVMGLYHDIGKLERPGYFAENQNSNNLHDKLPPEVSARIVFAHVKDGLVLAKKHRLGRAVFEAISQHQGTTLLRSFYLKASGNGQQASEQMEAMFRYPGPKPQSIEAAIVLLADSVEAATRALRSPAPQQVRERVAAIIEEKILDGQLDDSPLTLRDVGIIQAEFSRVLTLGVYHNRIEYPPMPNAVDRKSTSLDVGNAERQDGSGRGSGEAESRHEYIDIHKRSTMADKNSRY